MKKRQITRRCLRCNDVLKNRSKKTKHCKRCHLELRKIKANGRTTGFCRLCGNKLSLKKNATGHCILCVKTLPRKKFKQKSPAWNKGKSIFTSNTHKKQHQNTLRKIRRSKYTSKEFIPDRIRTLIRNSLKSIGIRKNTKTVKLLGCSIPEFIYHLEKQFVNGMNWNNYGNCLGEWNMDHIKPLALFNLNNENEQKTAFHYSNCRPLWAIENFSRPRKYQSNAITATVTFGYQR